MMAEERRELAWEAMTPEQRGDVRRELRDAISKYGEIQAELLEDDKKVSDNPIRLRETLVIINDQRRVLRESTGRLRKMPFGPERSAMAADLAKTTRDLTGAEKNKNKLLNR
jgi:hypothetical protein